MRTFIFIGNHLFLLAMKKTKQDKEIDENAENNGAEPAAGETGDIIE